MMLNKEDSSPVIDIHFKGIDGDGVAVAYVHRNFSARNMQSTNTILGSVLRQVFRALSQISDGVRKAIEEAMRKQKGRLAVAGSGFPRFSICSPSLCQV